MRFYLRDWVWTGFAAAIGVLLLAGCDAPATAALRPTLTEATSVDNTPTPAAPAPTARPAVLTNPGFEELDADGAPVGWTLTGDRTSAIVEERGHSGDRRLTHTGEQAYQARASQSVSGLTDGWYTLRLWARSSGGQNAVYAALVCGETETRVNLPSTMPGYRWLQLAVSAEVKGGTCEIRLVSDGGAGAWASFDDLELVPGRAALSVLGADVSSLKKSEDLGGVYRDANGAPGDALQILKDSGVNYARLRVWVDPPDGYHDQAELIEMARRLKALDYRLLVDFHYSDSWADPGKQIKPAAWAELDFEQLKQAVYDHTFAVCDALARQGTPPDMAQVGNEINAGLLWPDGDYEHFDQMAALLKEGQRAVKDCSPDTLVMLHIAEGGDNSLARWWFDNITRRDVPFDVIGISYYPYWHGSLPELQANLADISARYDKDVIVVETAYAFTEADADQFPNIANADLLVDGYPFTPEGQRALTRDVLAVTRGVPGGRGLGVFYWDPVWIAISGNGWDPADSDSGNAWENQALFDFDGRALPALEEFKP